MNIEITKRQVPVLAESDVLVCGAGCAGIAAAITAARHGCRVVLLERWPTVGGMATNALVNCWHRSDREKMVIYGLVEESVERAARNGWIRQDPQFPHAHETHWFDPEGMRIVWQRMLDETGVRVFCYMTVGEPIVEDGKILGVLVSTKRGQRAVLGRIVVDATGDGDVAAKAGVPFDFGRDEDGLVQGMTLMFRLHGIDPSAQEQRSQSVESVLSLMRRLRDDGQFPPFNEGNTRHYLAHADDQTLWNMLPEAGDPLDEGELSRLTAEARERLVTYLALWRQHLPGYRDVTIDETAFTLGIRESRRIRGVKALDRNMVLGATKHADAIGHGVWMIDIHDPKGTGYTTHTDRGTSNMLTAGTSYHIPLGMCLNHTIPNLACVGRCASSTHEAHSSVRVQTHCMVMGQGVGTAAALALNVGTELAGVDVGELQTKLRADGAYIEDVPNKSIEHDAPFTCGSSSALELLHVDHSRNMKTERVIPELPQGGAPIRLIIDTDAANEIDDLYAVALAAVSPDRFKIEGFIATHFAQKAGRESIQASYDVLQELFAAEQRTGQYTIVRGGDPMRYLTEPTDSDGARLIIERAKAGGVEDPLWVVGLGAATNLASAVLLDSSILPCVRYVFHARSEWSWPERSEQFNVGGDICAVRALLESRVPLVWFDTGQQLTCPMVVTEERLAPLGGMASFLHAYRHRSDSFQSDRKGFFDLGDIAWMIDPSVCTNAVCNVPHMDCKMTFSHKNDLGKMLRVTDAQPGPIWDMFFNRMSADVI